MAATTLKAIIDRFQVVLEGADLNLKKTTDEFSFDRQPNLRVNNVYRIADAGLVERVDLTNNAEVRLDQLDVWIARKATPTSQVERETLETDLRTIEEKLIADGPNNSYHVSLQGREIEREDDVITARLGMLVDYDVSLG